MMASQRWVLEYLSHLHKTWEIVEYSSRHPQDFATPRDAFAFYFGDKVADRGKSTEYRIAPVHNPTLIPVVYLSNANFTEMNGGVSLLSGWMLQDSWGERIRTTPKGEDMG
jgi:hypothetical protein